MLEHSKIWINFNFLCVGVAYLMIAAFMLFAPSDLATKGYLAMGVVFLSGSLVTLVKTLHDQRIAADITSKLERAKQEKLLAEYVENN